jgi:hypothetical protein
MAMKGGGVLCAYEGHTFFGWGGEKNYEISGVTGLRSIGCYKISIGERKDNT